MGLLLHGGVWEGWQELSRDWNCQIGKAELNGKLQGDVTAGYR